MHNVLHTNPLWLFLTLSVVFDRHIVGSSVKWGEFNEDADGEMDAKERERRETSRNGPIYTYIYIESVRYSQSNSIHVEEMGWILPEKKPVQCNRRHVYLALCHFSFFITWIFKYCVCVVFSLRLTEVIELIWMCACACACAYVFLKKILRDFISHLYLYGFILEPYYIIIGVQTHRFVCCFFFVNSSF